MTQTPSVFPLRAEILLASDIHLTDMGEKNARLLLWMLGEVERGQVETLVFLGDIFDFVLGTSRYFKTKYAAMGEALGRVAASGTRIVYVEGNHEFDVARLGWPGVTWVPEGDYTLVTGRGDRVKFAHGDMIYSSKTYQRFRRVVKSPVVRHGARLFPGRFVDRLATRSSDLSRAQDQYRVIDHDAILGAANRWADATPCDHGIFGHFHVPYAEARHGAPGKLLSVDCWEKPNFLMLRDGEFFRLHMGEVGAEPTVAPARPITTAKPAGG